MVKNKKGISLIVLIVTVIVIIILTSIIVITFSNNNPIGKSNEAKFKSDLSGFRDELTATHIDKSTINPDYVPEDVNVNLGEYTKMREYIPDITEKYASKLFIKNGKLLYIGDDTSSDYKDYEEKYAKEIGIQAPYGNIGDADGDGYVTWEDVKYISDNIPIHIDSLSERQKKAMNVNGDDKIDVKDATMLAKYLEGGIDLF